MNIFIKQLGLFIIVVSLWNPRSHKHVPNYMLCVPKRIPDIIDCNLKKDDQILIVSGMNIPEATGH